tara:strand:+ start:86 stop:493 length:408 start_codon:yes stop_codon:yes gene_type:complete
MKKLLSVLLLCFIGCNTSDSDTNFQKKTLKSKNKTRINKEKPAPKKIKVTYKVEYICDDGCDLTYTNEYGGTEQISINNDWTYDFISTPGKFTYLSAQLQNSGWVSVEILCNNNTFKHAMSSSDFGIASVSGSIP